MHIAAKLAELAAAHPDRTAIVDEAGPHSFRQFVQRTARLGNAIRGLGLARGDRVALLIPDIREYLEADYGLMAAGFVRVPTDPRLTRNELASLLRFAGARAIITHASFAEKVEGLAGDVDGLNVVVGIGGGFDRDYETLLEGASDQLPRIGDGDNLATLNFSGGTTGTPKAVMLRHRNLLAVAESMRADFDIGPESVFLNVRPLWPIAQVILMSHLFAGATVVFGGRADPNQLTDRIAQSGATRTSLVPTQLVRWLNHVQDRDVRLDRLQAIYVGGSRIPPSVFERALALLGPKIGPLYGMTEAPVTAYLPPRDFEAADRSRLMASVGRALTGYELRIDSDSPEQPGEVLVRGGNVMAGYWQNEAATNAALADGWLHTGDIGQLDPAGNLFIVGRLNDVIRSGASSIMPKEVEDAIASHPAVDDVAVLGLPDIEWGEAVTAFVVLKPGLAASEQELAEHCRKHLASYKKPRSFRFVPSLPRSHYGKVIRSQLLAQAAASA
jgi:acyl-CoA synthetase (AMP-forming)/AMP-acid ligase II